MKRTFKGVLFFLMVFFLVFIFRFPYEEMILSILSHIERDRGVHVSWEWGNFSLLGFRLRGVEVLGNGRALFQMEDVRIRPSLLRGLVVSFREKPERGKGKGELRLGFSRNFLSMEDMALPETLSSSLGEGRLSIDGSCARRMSEGKGRFKARLTRFPLPLVQGELDLQGEFSYVPRDLKLSFEIKGQGLSGKGQADVALADRDVSYSGISGVLDVKVGQTPFVYNLSGTLRQLQMMPQAKSGGSPAQNF